MAASLLQCDAATQFGFSIEKIYNDMHVTEREKVMSQEKVNKYKEEKANRQQAMRKERMMSFVRKAVLVVVAAALVGWIGHSAVVTYINAQPRQVAEVNFDAVSNYLTELESNHDGHDH